MDISPIILEGARARLEPLELSHHEQLCEVGLDERLWRLTVLKVKTPGDMLKYIEMALAAEADGTALPFVIIEKTSNKIIGTSRFHNINLSQKRVDIGFTWLAVQWQRTGINPEAKYLMLKHAFEHFGCVRVEFKVNAVNEPSCRALLRIGAKHEGTLRNYMISTDGSPRDVAIFSIIDSEWPAIKARLEQRMASKSEGLV